MCHFPYYISYLENRNHHNLYALVWKCIHRCRMIFIRLVSPKNENSLFIRHTVSFSNSLCGKQFSHYYYYYYFQCGSATKCRVRFKIINLIIFELLIHRWKRVRNRSMGLYEHCITYASTCWFECDPSLASFAQSNVFWSQCRYIKCETASEAIV